MGKYSSRSAGSNRSTKSSRSTRSNRSSSTKSSRSTRSNRSSRSNRSVRSRPGGLFRRTASLSDSGFNLHHQNQNQQQKKEDLEQLAAATCNDISDTLNSCMSIHSLSESLGTSYGTGSVAASSMGASSRSPHPCRRGSNESSIATSPSSSRLHRGTLPTPEGEGQARRKVSFGVVEARAFIRTVGDHPAVSSGAAMDLTWKYKPIAPRSLDEYESTRAPRRSGSNLIVSRFDREELLRKQCDIAKKQLVIHVRSTMKTKSQRRQTLNNLRFHKMEETAEKMGRNLARAVGLRKSSDREIDDLWEDALVKLSFLKEELKGQTESESEETHASLWRKRISQAEMGSKNISESKPANANANAIGDSERISCISHGETVEMSKAALENIARRERAEMSFLQKLSTSLGKKMKSRRKRNGDEKIRRGNRKYDDDLMDSSSKHPQVFNLERNRSDCLVDSSSKHSRVFNLERKKSDDLDIMRHQRSDCDDTSNNNSRHRSDEETDKDMMNNNSSRKKYDLGLDLDMDGDDVSILSNEHLNEFVSDADSKPAAKPDMGFHHDLDIDLDSIRFPKRSDDLDEDLASASELDDGEFVTLNVSTEPQQLQDCSHRPIATTSKSPDEDSGLGDISASIPTTYLTKELLVSNESEHSSIGNSTPSHLNDDSSAVQSNHSGENFPKSPLQNSENIYVKDVIHMDGNRPRGLSSSSATASTAITSLTCFSSLTSTSRRSNVSRIPIVAESKRLRSYTNIKRKCILATEETCPSPSTR